MPTSLAETLSRPPTAEDIENWSALVRAHMDAFMAGLDAAGIDVAAASGALVHLALRFVSEVWGPQEAAKMAEALAAQYQDIATNGGSADEMVSLVLSHPGGRA